jgi:hypothetical protein
MFRTRQERLPKELVLAGMTDVAAANRYLMEVYMPAFNAEFVQPAFEEGSAFVPWISFVSVMNTLWAMITVLALKAFKASNPGRSPSLPLCESKSHRTALSKRTNGYHAWTKKTCNI